MLKCSGLGDIHEIKCSSHVAKHEGRNVNGSSCYYLQVAFFFQVSLLEYRKRQREARQSGSKSESFSPVATSPHSGGCSGNSIPNSNDNSSCVKACGEQWESIPSHPPTLLGMVESVSPIETGNKSPTKQTPPTEKKIDDADVRWYVHTIFLHISGWVKGCDGTH